MQVTMRPAGGQKYVVPQLIAGLGHDVVGMIRRLGSKGLGVRRDEDILRWRRRVMECSDPPTGFVPL